LEKLRKQLPPNSSALLTMAKEAETKMIIAGLQVYKAAVITLALGAEASISVADAVVADASNLNAAEEQK
jgi:uncharacterized membrane protein